MSGDSSGPGASFEERLRAARQRQGLDEPLKAPTASVPSGSGSGLRAGIELVSAEAVAGAIGWGLDHWLHTLPLFLIIFILLGGAAGLMNVWRLYAPPGRARPVDDGKG
jgi:ATP synthase protein I